MASLDGSDRRVLDGGPPEHRWGDGWVGCGWVGTSRRRSPTKSRLAAAPAKPRGPSSSCPPDFSSACLQRSDWNSNRAELSCDHPSCLATFTLLGASMPRYVDSRTNGGTWQASRGLPARLTTAFVRQPGASSVGAPVAHAPALQAPSSQDVRAAKRIGRELQRFGNVTSRLSMWHTAALLSPWSLVVQGTADREILLPPQPVPRKFSSPDEEVSFVHYALGATCRCALRRCLLPPVGSAVCTLPACAALVDGSTRTDRTLHPAARSECDTCRPLVQGRWWRCSSSCRQPRLCLPSPSCSTSRIIV